jgi:hypothetical protein
MVKNIRVQILVGAVVAAVGTLSTPVRAEEAPIPRLQPLPSPYSAEVSERPSSSPPGPRLTSVQLEKFAELLGEPSSVVWRNLLADPSLVPYAARAAEIRQDRKNTGKIMTIVGFSILGVGSIVGYVVMLQGIGDINCSSDYSYNNSCSSGSDSAVLTGLLIGLASVGIGLGIGIPGIVKMARQTDEETEAVNRYQYSVSLRSPAPSRYEPTPYSPNGGPYPPSSLGKTLRVPLLSFSF